LLRDRRGRPGCARRPGRAGRPGRAVTAVTPAAGRRVRVAVIGCGAMGSLYAAHLARVPEVEVWVVDPWAEHMAAIAADGLRVTGLADFTADVHPLTDRRGLPRCHVGLVATK